MKHIKASKLRANIINEINVLFKNLIYFAKMFYVICLPSVVHYYLGSTLVPFCIPTYY